MAATTFPARMNTFNS